VGTRYVNHRRKPRIIFTQNKKREIPRRARSVLTGDQDCDLREAAEAILLKVLHPLRYAGSITPARHVSVTVSLHALILISLHSIPPLLGFVSGIHWKHSSAVYVRSRSARSDAVLEGVLKLIVELGSGLEFVYVGQYS
jgi:hypothetical protein